MIFHYSYELPEPISTELNHASEEFTPEEVRILKSQIRKNALLIDNYVSRLDLFVNKEKVPKKVEFVLRLRKRLEVLMEENDTFRKVLWKYHLAQQINHRF